MIRITPNVALADWELVETFKRASGPGGQNVNKVETAVELRFDAARSPSLAPAVKGRLIRLAGARATKDGVIVIEAQSRRTQGQNREDARKRLVALIRAALRPPKVRRETTVPPGVKRRRVEAKKKRGEVKALRRAPAGDA